MADLKTDPVALPGRLMTLRLVLTFGVFIMLGLPEGVLGTVWPSMRDTHDRATSNLSILLVLYIAGYLVATVGSGRLSQAVGADRLTRIGIGLTATGLALYAASPTWLVAVGAAATLGAGAGLVDATINAEVALRYGPRVMHLLHASFGVGATLGPLLVVAVLGADRSWRLAFVVLLVIELGLLGSLLLSRRSPSATLADENTPVLGSSARPDLVLAATLVYFAVYVATEVSVGQWSYSVLFEERGYSEGVAGTVVAGYWGGLTVGRLLLGVVDERLGPLTLLRWASALAVAASVWFWLDWGPSAAALPLLGLAFAGVFPSLVLLTPQWIGSDRTAHAVGYQLAASSAGAAVATICFGVLADRQGLDSLPVAFVGLAVVLGIAHLATETAARR